MSDDEVLQALKVLKRHGQLDDSFFFHTVTVDDTRGNYTNLCVFLPEVITVTMTPLGDRYRSTFSSGTHVLMALSLKEFNTFFLKWKQAKLAMLL